MLGASGFNAVGKLCGGRGASAPSMLKLCRAYASGDTPLFTSEATSTGKPPHTASAIVAILVHAVRRVSLVLICAFWFLQDPALACLYGSNTAAQLTVAFRGQADVPFESVVDAWIQKHTIHTAWPQLKRRKVKLCLHQFTLAQNVFAGGRDGEVRSADGNFSHHLALPKQLGGTKSGSSTNPEQMLAAGFSACFLSALGITAQQQKLSVPNDATVKGEFLVWLLNSSPSLPGITAWHHD